MPDTSLPISNKGTNGSPITDTNGNPVAGVEVSLWRRVLNDTNSDGEGDEITDTKLLARTQTDSNGEYEFTEDDLPVTYVQGNPEVIYYCTVHAVRVEAGSGDPLDNGRIKAYPSDNEPAASDYMAAYSLEAKISQYGDIQYPVDESSGTTLNDRLDQTSPTSTATINGGTTCVKSTEGVNSYYLEFDGTDDYVITDSNISARGDKFTACGWFRLRDFTAFENGLLSSGPDPDSQAGWYLSTDGSGELINTYNTNANVGGIPFVSSGKWGFVAVQGDSGNGMRVQTWNTTGQLHDTGFVNGAGTRTVTDDKLQIGVENELRTGFADMDADFVVFADDLISDTKIKELWQQTNSR
jgi:hypothetical protein